MKIEHIKITKFRSIEDGEFNVNGITAIIGQNNSGKTAIMRALNSFFHPELEIAFYKDGTNLYTSRNSIPRIAITFSLTNIKPIYAPYVTNFKLQVRQEFNKKRNRLDYFVLAGTQYQSASEDLLKELFLDIQFVLIPTQRNTHQSQATNERSILRKLLDNFFATHTANRDTLSPKVKDAFQYLKRNALTKVAKGIENNFLASRGIHVDIDSMFDISYELFMNDLSIKIVEEGKEFNLSECGSGIQSLVAISIYRYLADLSNGNYIIGIEEPEVNLHPQAQKELIFTLLDEVNSGLQLIFTTHSPVLIDELEHTNIVLVRKEKDVIRKFKTTIHQISSSFWTQYNLQTLQYTTFHKFRNSEFFFANHVMVVESPNDAEVFRELLKKENILLEKHGISVISLGGIKSLKYAFYLLRDLKIPKTIIVDKDFFLDYRNGSTQNSRYGNGFYMYKSQYKTDPLISEILDNLSAKVSIEKHLTSNHSKALDELSKFDVICMKCNLEMDLISSTTACNLIYNKLNIPIAQRTTFVLFNQYEQALKRLELLLYVIQNLQRSNLPNSYKCLIRRFKAIINN